MQRDLARSQVRTIRADVSDNRFIEIQFRHHRICPFKMYDLMVFNIPKGVQPLP